MGCFRGPIIEPLPKTYTKNSEILMLFEDGQPASLKFWGFQGLGHLFQGGLMIYANDVVSFGERVFHVLTIQVCLGRF